MHNKIWLLFMIGTLLITAGTVFINLTAEEGDEKHCDLKDIRTAYCCPECNTIYEKPGRCEECLGEDGKGIPLEEIRACVKTGYTCDNCGSESLKPGKCEKCNRERTANTVWSGIVYRCPKCGWDYDAPGNCEDCTTNDGKPVKLEKTCEYSGIFPHISEEEEVPEL